MMSSEPPQSASIQINTEPPPFWRDERVLRVAAQVISAVVIIGFLIWMVDNVIAAAAQRGLNLGFGFLSGEAGFPIGETDLPYTPASSFAFAFLVGVVNTLKVSILGVILATILGTILGVARLSTNWLVSRIALAFIEIHRNIPLLVLLYLWYSGIFIQLPRVKDSFVWPGPTYINQRGVYFTWGHVNENTPLFLALTGLGILSAIIAFIWLRRIRELTGRSTYFGAVSLGLLFIFPLIGLLISGGHPFILDVPSLQGFNFKGGLHLTPEFTALLIGLVTYTAAFIAEVVRAGIQAVSRGQLEAASALGLKSYQVLGLVIMPQALRIIIPPLISQYLNLTKNSSLAIFIGYPELFFMGKTTINQAGRAVQVFVLVVLVYLAMSLFTSLILNFYNRRIQLVER